jgi:TP901 family phage tail tape measure protein
MADALIDIAMQFKIADLESAMNDFKQITEGATISPKIKADRTLIMEQFKTIIEQAQKQMAAGTLDPASLGLPKLIANVETIYRNLAKNAGIILSKEFKDLTDKALQTSTEIDDLTSKLKGMEDEKKNLTSTKIIAQAKGDTGFTGAAVGGSSLEEAKKQLNQLNKIEEAGAKVPGLKKKILFYTRLVALFTQAKDKFKQYGNDSKIITTKLNKLKKEQVEIQEKLTIETQKNAGVENPEMQKLVGVVTKLTGVKVNALDVTKALTNETKKQNKASREAADGNNHEAKSLTQKATAAFSYYLVFNQLKRVFNDTLRTLKELDKAMTDAAIVTSMNRKEAWALLDSYQQLAKRTGLATSEIALTVTQFLRQGRTIKDAMELTEVAAKSAKVAGISASEAVNYLTSAVNGFNLAANQSEQIADKFAAIAARSATSFEELALAMSKVAPTAKSAGVSVDFMMGVIAKGIETTREAPENIGTAFKTIFARMREVTDLGRAMEDGMDLNRVEKALGSVGVPLRDVAGQFRNLETVLIEVGDKWETLTSVEQAYLATALAGSRQQPRLLAIFNDFARTKELIQISAEATGELANQHVQYMKGSEAALAILRTSWQEFTNSFIDIEIVIGLIQTFSSVLESATAVFQGLGNNTQWFTTILIGLGAAYALITSKKLIMIFVQKLQSIVTLAQVKTSKQLSAALKVNSKEFFKLTLIQQKQTMASLSGAITTKVLAKALLAKAAAALKAAAAMGLLLIKMLPLILAAAAVAGIIYLVSKRNEEAGRNAEYFAEKMAELNSEISKLTAREREIKKLTDRFEELSKKTALSVDQLREMQDIAKQLSSIEVEGETFNLTRQDITGKIVIDEKEYERYLEFIQNARETLIAESLVILQDALRTDFEGTLDNPTLMQTFRSFGLNIALAFVEGMDDASPDLVDRMTRAAQLAADTFKPIEGMREQFVVTRGMTGSNKSRFDTREQAERFQRLYGGTISTEQVEGGVDFDAHETFVEGILEGLETVYRDLDENISEIMEDDTIVDKKAEIFAAQADSYADALKAIQDQAITEGWTTEQLSQAISFLGATMQDEAVLNNLINERRIDAAVIAKMSVDLDIGQLEEVFDDMDDFLSKTRIVTVLSCGVNIPITVPRLTAQEQAVFKERFEGILGDLFSDSDTGVTAGFTAAKTYIDDLVAAGIMTAEEGRRYIISLSNQIKTISLEDSATLLKEQMELSKEMFDLSNRLGQGDFSSFAKMVETFGLDTTKAVLSKNTEALEDFFEEQNNMAKDRLRESIARIKGTAFALGRDMTPQELAQVEAYEIMIDYYDKLAVREQLRNFRLGEATNLLKRMNDVLSLQDKLSNLGFSGGIFDIFRDMADSYYEDGLGFLTTQVQADFANLADFMTQGGLFNPDDLGLGQAAIDNAIGSLNTLVDAVTDAYNRQRRVIEDRYKTELDAIKSSHSDRWATIDYTNKLAEAENRVLASRRLLMGLALSGVSKGVMDQTEADLKKLQQERQKIIEDQAVKKAEDQMKIDMDRELLAIQTELTTTLSTLGVNLQTYSNVLLQNTEPQVVLQTILSANSDTVGLNTEAIVESTATTGDLITSNGHVVDAINDLILVFRPGLTTPTGTPSNNTTGLERPTGKGGMDTTQFVGM